MEDGRKEKFSVGKSARAVCKRHPGKLLRLGLLHFLPRAVAIVPVYILAVQASIPISMIWGAGVLGVLFFLLYLMPSRFYLGEVLWSLAAGKATVKERYLPFLKAGLFRLGRGILWGLPFMAGLSLFLYGMEYLPYNELGKVLQKFVLFGESTVARGLVIVLLLLLVLLLLFAFGWRRDMAWEYLPLSQGGMVRKVRRQGKGKLMGNTAVNALFSLPALLGCLAVLLPYAQDNVRVSSNLLRTVQSLLQLMKTALPLTQTLWLLAVAAALYMPFFLYRKMRCAVLMQELAREIQEGQDAA